MAAEILLDTPHLRVAARTHGDAETGSPVLALHGWLDNAASFELIGPRIAERLGLYIVAIDMPGHGLTEHRPAGVNQYFPDHVVFAMSVIHALGWQRLSLIGHSMGAGVSSMLAGTFPEYFDRVVLIDGLGPMADEPDDAPRRLRSAIEDSFARIERAENSVRLKAAIRARARVGHMSTGSARLLIERNLRKDESTGDYLWRSDNRLKTPSAARLVEDQVQAFLRRIDASVLLLLADDSHFRDLSMEHLIKNRVELVPRIQVETLSGGHHLHMENSSQVGDRIIRFFE